MHMRENGSQNTDFIDVTILLCGVRKWIKSVIYVFVFTLLTKG